MDALIAHVMFDQEKDTFTTSSDAPIQEIDATLIPFSPYLDPRLPQDIPSPVETCLKVFPDIGASICLGGPQHLTDMGLSVNHLVPSSKVVRAVGNFTLVCKGWLPVTHNASARRITRVLHSIWPYRSHQIPRKQYWTLLMVITLCRWMLSLNTTFITEWGRFMYLRMPQGYLASGDTYTRRYDEVIKDVDQEVKYVDDVLLYDSGI